MATIDEVYELLNAVNKQTLKLETDHASAFKRIEERSNHTAASYFTAAAYASSKLVA